jgi:hypothetical protein
VHDLFGIREAGVPSSVTLSQMADEEYQETMQVPISDRQAEASFEEDRVEVIFAPPYEEDRVEVLIAAPPAEDRVEVLIAHPHKKDSTRHSRLDPFPPSGSSQSSKKKKPLPAQHVITTTTTQAKPFPKLKEPRRIPPLKPNAAGDHTCPTCQKNFPWASMLQMHISSHTEEKPGFECEKCGKDCGTDFLNL